MEKRGHSWEEASEGIRRFVIGLAKKILLANQLGELCGDKAYRRESGRSAFYEVSANAFDEVYSLFQELDGEAFAGAIDNLWRSVQDLARDPGNAVNQGVFMQRCTASSPETAENIDCQNPSSFDSSFAES